MPLGEREQFPKGRGMGEPDGGEAEISLIMFRILLTNVAM